MAGKAAIRIGGITPLAMTVTGLTGTDMSSQGMTGGKGEAGRTLMAARMRPGKAGGEDWPAAMVVSGKDWHVQGVGEGRGNESR